GVRSAGAVGRLLIGASVPTHRASGVGFGDVDGHVAALVVVVGAACEHPVGRAAWIVGEAGPQVEAAAGGRAARVHARDRARGAGGGGDTAEAVAPDHDVGVGFVDVDG